MPGQAPSFGMCMLLTGDVYAMLTCYGIRLQIPVSVGVRIGLLR